MLNTQTVSNSDKRFSLKSQRHWIIASLATATLFASVGTLFPSQAMAAETSNPKVETVSRQVRIGDLNLARPKDKVRLKHRIKIAAREMCVTGGLAGIANARREKRCISDAVHLAMEQVSGKSQLATLVQ
ncbi:UrcA family protein [Parasphingorhabdus sp.]|uniref:UrcA family protein n=1 Tax=Parasphingorhabdus sp. TaxID=2709688 RepID=UPI003263C90F